MGCNVEKAKVKIADIINSGMKSNSIASSEKAMKQAEQFANVLDKIKSNYVLNKDAKQDIEQDASENITNNIEQDIESKTPYFDALPSYKDKQRNMIYAGIGSRETPAEVLKEMTNIAKWLNEKQYKLQTGATFKGKEEGADKAFSDGSSNKELFRPESANDITISIAKEIHPAPQNLKPGGLKLMARNTNQIFGKDLDTPVDFVLFYAEETSTIRPKGGTGQAVEMARKKGIPTINMSNKDWKKELAKVLNNRGTEENIQKPNFENVSKQKEPAVKSGSDEKVPAKQTEIELRKNNPNFTASNFNIKKEIKSSMDNKTTENVDIISTDVTKINIKDELLGFVASGASAYDNNVDMDFFGNFIETIKKVSANLEKYGLDKNIEFRQHKMATDRYTRGTYTFGEDVAKDNSHLSGSDSGYMFEIDGGVVDIYYGKGFYNETEDGIVQNELRQDISLSTNPELIMHEILHSMIEKAYDQDKELNRALFLLKEQVMKKISYKDLLGKDESEATNAEIQLAKDIYAYMHNPTEFLAYAATNQNVFLAVKDLTIKNTLIGKFEPKRGDTIGKFKQFLNRFIDAINKIYTSMTTGESAKTEFDKILNGLIEVNTKIEIGAIDIKMEKEFKPYAAFGLGEKFKKTNDWMLEAEKGAFSKLKDVWSADTVRNKAEGAGRFIESIGNWRGLQWLRDTRLISDLVTDMVEDTTSDGVAWFYEAVRHIKGTREKDKLDFATVMKKKVGAEFGEFSKEERSAVTFMLQGDWKALGVSLSEYKDMLTDESKVESRISDLKSQIKHSEYINQSAMLGYYLVNGEAKGSATMKSAYQIVHRFHTGKESSPLQSEIDTDSMIKLVDELSSLYAIKYTEKSTKDNIVSAIERDADVVSFGSDTYYAYRLKEQNGQLAMFGKYMDKGYVRKSGEVDMKFDIIPESKLIRNSKISSLNHKIIRELPEVQNNMHDAGLNNSFEKYYLVVERDMDPARTQGVLDDISIIEQGQELASFTAGKSIDYSDMKSYTTRRFGAYEKTYLNKPIDDSLEAMRDRKSYSISNIDINGNIVGYAEPVSEADKVNHGRINNDIADVLGNTASHIQSKEKALLNNQNFIELLIADSNNNIGTPGYVFISPDSREVELQKYWAMIPDYSRSFIEHETAVKGLWVKLSRINNIVGHKDVSISNMKLFGLKLEDYPEWQKSIKIVEHTWKEIASAYKEIIVKLMPNVILSNTTSNMFVALRHGIGPMEYAKGFRKAWSELSEYMELNEQLVSLKIDRDIGKKGLNPKIAELEKRLERNGMHPLIKDGQFSMIFEDLDKDSTSKSTHLKDVSSAKIEQWFGKNVADNLEEFRQNIYITKETRGHQAIEKLTLFNDIINKKIIMDKMTQDINEINFATPEAKEAAMIDMINYLDQLFVNYSYLTNKYIKWASDLNIILFIKYFLRAGKAALNMTRRQPLGSLVAESFDTFLWNIPDPIDQYMTPVSTVSGKIGLSPIDMIGEVLFPRIITIMPW